MPNGATSERSMILCAGLNAHNQLSDSHTNDIREFAPLTNSTCESFAGDNLQVLFAGWSVTVIAGQNKLWSLGFSPTTASDASITRHEIKTAFGDHNGLLGLLYEEANLLMTQHDQDGTSTLINVTSESSPRLGAIALASNERVAVTFQQAPNGRLCHVVEFQNLEKFAAWYQDPSGEGHYPDSHNMLPGRPKQLLANVADFLLLMEDGEVYSWGDPRHQSLGRSIIGEGKTPADKPGMLEALGGLKIAKLACGGWMCAALSEDRALYLWGASMPGTERRIKCLTEAGAGEVALVELSDDAGEPMDVLDAAIGDGHVVIITKHSDHTCLWVAGDNENGQLGLDSKKEFIEDWMEVRSVSSPRWVACGPNSTCVFGTRS